MNEKIKKLAEELLDECERQDVTLLLSAKYQNEMIVSGIGEHESAAIAFIELERNLTEITGLDIEDFKLLGFEKMLSDVSENELLEALKSFVNLLGDEENV